MRRLNMWAGIVVASVLVSCLPGRAQDDFERSVAAETKGSIDALLSLYDEQANTMLPILIPDESGSIRQVIDFGRVTINEQSGDFPEAFLNLLSAKGVYNADYDVMTYPILIILDERTHDYMLSAHDGTELLRVERPKDYDPLWYTIAYFKQRDLQPTRQEFKAHALMYNPARIVGLMDLVTAEGARAIAVADSDALAASLLQPPPPMMLLAGGPYVDSLSIEGIVLNSPTNGYITLTVGYPSGMQGVPLDIIGCDDLMDWNWSVLASTNAPGGTNRFEYVISPIATNREFVTVYRTDVPAGDTDGDGVPNGEERFLDGSDADNPDDPANIKGMISYTTGHGGGGQTGVIYVVAVTNLSDWSTDVSDSVAVTGAYHIIKVPHGDYFIKAWRDSDGNGLVETYEATGMYYSAAITVTSQWTGIDVSLTDPDSDADLMGDWWEDYYFEGLFRTATGDQDIDKLQNLYEYYLGSNPVEASPVDSDGDGMYDDWERYYGLDRFSDDAEADADGDGFSNLAEFQQTPATDPQDKDSHPVYFVDVTATAFPGAGSLASSQNAAWGDYDNDGDPDLYLSTGLWRNDSGTFTNIPNTAFGPGLWLDTNNDGYLDIFSWAAGSVTNWGLYTNRIPAGVEGFAKDTIFPVPPRYGSTPGFSSRGACPVDLDSDGHIDLYVGGYESWETNLPSRISYRDTMVRNMRGITGSTTSIWEISYQDAIHSASDIGAHQFRTTDKANPAKRTKGITACDYDEDGDTDIHVSVYRTSGNRLWSGLVGRRHFDAGGFLDISGFGNSIGSVWGDLDNDGYFDLFTANLRHDSTPQYDDSQFYRNLGPADGYRFANMTDDVNLPWQEADSNPTMADFDRDGDLDLFVTCSTGGYPGRGRLFRNDGQWLFTEVTDSSGLPTNTSGQGTDQNAWTDFNGDGALDLFTGGKLYRNRTSAGNWIKLKLNGDGSVVNRAAVGTVVEIYLGGKTLVRQVEGAVGEGNQNSPVLHFGLATNAGPLNVTIRWPGHSGTIVTNLAVNQSHTLNYTSPANDNFANAVPLPGLSGRLTIRNGSATLETGEPEHMSSGTGSKRSIWWRFSPPTNGYLTVRCPEEYFTHQPSVLLALYRGTVLTNLVELKKSSSRGLYVIPVEAEQNYRLAAADLSAGVTNRTIALEWAFETTGLWRVDATYANDNVYWPSEKWVTQAPSGTPAGTRPFGITASDLPDGSIASPARLLFWPQPGTRRRHPFWMRGEACFGAWLSGNPQPRGN